MVTVPLSPIRSHLNAWRRRPASKMRCLMYQAPTPGTLLSWSTLIKSQRSVRLVDVRETLGIR